MGNPCEATDCTVFADCLLNEKLAVVKQSYFTTCLEKGDSFADRANIPECNFFSGASVIANWQKFGARFLVIVSYSWLTEYHPDPEGFHLSELVYLLKEFSAYTRQD